MNGKLTINQISIENGSKSSLSLEAAGLKGNTLEITNMLVKNASGNVVQVVNLESSPVRINADGSQTIMHVNLTQPLTRGDEYTITLVSKDGGAFHSPTFVVP